MIFCHLEVGKLRHDEEKNRTDAFLERWVQSCSTDSAASSVSSKPFTDFRASDSPPVVKCF